MVDGLVDVPERVDVAPADRHPDRGLARHQRVKTSLPNTSPAASAANASARGGQRHRRLDHRPHVALDAQPHEPLELVARAHRRADHARAAGRTRGSGPRAGRRRCVAPEITSVPPGLSAFSEWSHVAAPTVSSRRRRAPAAARPARTPRRRRARPPARACPPNAARRPHPQPRRAAQHDQRRRDAAARALHQDRRARAPRPRA